MKTPLFSFVLLTTLLAACQPTPVETPVIDEPTDEEPSDETEVQSLTLTETIPSESGNYEWNTEIEGGPFVLEDDLLTLNLGYGGCAKVDFELNWDNTMPADENVSLYLTRPMPAEMECMMYINDTLQFDLTPVKEHYQEQLSESGALTLYIARPASAEAALVVNYSF